MHCECTVINKPNKPLSDDESELFRREMANLDVEAGDYDENREPDEPKRTTARTNKRIRRRPQGNEGVLVDEQTVGGDVKFARGGVQERTWRKLKRGNFSIDAQLDLHGCTSADARKLLRDFFVNECTEESVKVVTIIHGKGMRSGEGGEVLRSLTYDWLKQQSTVRAFCSAQPRDGGYGAVYVLLR